MISSQQNVGQLIGRSDQPIGIPVTPTPERSFDGPHLRPPAGTITVDLRRLAIQVESATNTRGRIGCEQHRREPKARITVIASYAGRQVRMSHRQDDPDVWNVDHDPTLGEYLRPQPPPV